MTRFETAASVRISLSGLSFGLYGAGNTAGRKYAFNLSGFAGGDSYSLHRNAANKWVYAALGMDLATRTGSVVVRDMDGNVLDRNICFCRAMNLQQNFANALPADQRAAALDQGHAHNDYLDVNFYALGLPAAVDLACRDEGTQTWSRPGAG